MKIFRILLIAGLIPACALRVSAKDFFLKDGDRVVFYGDSITDQGLYTTFVETYVLTRFPKLRVSFVNSAWSGDKVTGGRGGSAHLRLTRDILSYRPTVVTMMLGMNDGGYRILVKKLLNTYTEGCRGFVSALKRRAPGVRITVIQPSPYDDFTRLPAFVGGYNSVLLRYGAYLRELAGREKLIFADFNRPLTKAVKTIKTIDSGLAMSLLPDRVHPGPAGHLLMAGELLKAWNAPPVVSEVEISFAKKAVVAVSKAKVYDLVAGRSVSWTQLDEALPLPVDVSEAVLPLALKVSGFVDNLNRQTLTVTGLPDPNYELKIDTETAGFFTREQLAAGINLAVLQTPMVRQALKVHQLTLRHNAVHFKRWRTVQVPMADDETPNVVAAVKALIKALDEEEYGVVRLQRAAAQPEPHRFVLLPK